MIITRLALQNNSFGGQHSRWGLGGIIRAGGPESAELSKPGAPNLLNNTHTPATVCDYAFTGVTYGNQRLWKAAAMTANLLPSEANCCSTPKRDVPADKATGSPHLEVLPGGGGGVSEQPRLRSLGSAGFRQHAGRRPFPRLGGSRRSVTTPPMCLHLKPALFGPRRRRQSCRVGPLALSAGGCLKQSVVYF